MTTQVGARPEIKNAFGARYHASSLGRFMTPDWSDDPYEPVPYADLENPQSLNLYSYVLNNPVTSVDPDGHDCITTSNASGNGVTVTFTRGTCDGIAGGSYIEGTVDASSLTYNGNTGVLGYNYAGYDGSGGGGIIQVPQNDDSQRLQQFADEVARGSSGAEILGPALANMASLPFPMLMMGADLLASSGDGTHEAVIPRLGTGGPGSNERLNKMARDAAKAAGLDKDQARRLHDILQDEAPIAERRLSFQEIKEIAFEILRGIR